MITVKDAFPLMTLKMQSLTLNTFTFCSFYFLKQFLKSSWMRLWLDYHSCHSVLSLYKACTFHGYFALHGRREKPRTVKSSEKSRWRNIVFSWSCLSIGWCSAALTIFLSQPIKTLAKENFQDILRKWQEGWHMWYWLKEKSSMGPDDNGTVYFL